MDIFKEFERKLANTLHCSPIIYIPHFDYEMTDTALLNVVRELGFPEKAIDEYDLHKGIVDFATKIRDNSRIQHKELDVWLETIEDAEETDVERIFLSKNWQEQIFNNLSIQTLLQNFAAKHKHGDYDTEKGGVYSIVIVSPMPVTHLPSALEKYITVLDFPSPTMDDVLKEVQKIPVANSVVRLQSKESFQEEMTYTLMGLQMYEVKQVLKKSALARSGQVLKKESLDVALGEKQQIVKKSGIVEVVERSVRLEDIGGLERLRKDINKKAKIFEHLNEVQGRNIGLPFPKGCLILGMPGCGKSMIAKAIASAFKVALLRLDVNRLMGQYVGMSEENLRRALQMAEIAHPCVLWIDEVEKAFAGAGDSGGEGSMLVQRLMGQFLTWMQERTTPVYIVATANDVMKPEFMRKGRFDEVYFVDFPNVSERKAILKAKLDRYGLLNPKKETIYDFSDFVTDGKTNRNFDEIAEKMCGSSSEKTKDGFSNGFSGAEIESVVNQVMENAFIEYQTAIDDRRPLSGPIKITLSDFENVISEMRSAVMANQVVSEEEKKENPLRKTNIERIRELQMTYHFKNATE